MRVAVASVRQIESSRAGCRAVRAATLGGGATRRPAQPLVRLHHTASTKRSFQRGQSGGGCAAYHSSSSPLHELAPGAIAPQERQWDVVALAQSCIDLTADTPDDVLQQLGVPKGGRRVIGVKERMHALELLERSGCTTTITAGGSLANSLVNVRRLSQAAADSDPLRVCLAGPIGSNETCSAYFRSQLEAAGVYVPPRADPASHTGTVMVLCTPDAQRSFLSCFPEERLALPDGVLSAVSAARYLVVEGYLWEMAGAREAIAHAMAAARASGAQVVLTAGDAGVVRRNRDAILGAIAAGVDMLFMNAAEAAELLQPDAPAAAAALTAQQAAQQLAGLCPTVVVTDGPNGAIITALGQLHVIPPHWLPHPPVDTCGAGDAFAAGVLYALLRGHDLRAAGDFAARVASVVISRHGAQLMEEDAAGLAAQLPRLPLPLELLLGSRPPGATAATASGNLF